MNSKILTGQEKITVIGMGYVGLPLAVAFAEKGASVIGFDLNELKINKYKNGEDPTNEVGEDRLKTVKTIEYTTDEKKISEGKFIIVAVPTPVGKNNIPDLGPVEGASRVIGRNLIKGSYVVFESTVYPGVTEDICVPILEKESGLKCGVDFKVGYSPERVNPGDKVNTVETIVKIVSGMDEESLGTIAKVYEIIVRPGVHRASSIKVAEAAKVIENSQRDVNIAFVNELAMIFEKMGIDTHEVLEAAGTKWNFLKFLPGLVGGHCIGVDPYYLTYKSEELGYISQLILSGRRINDGMSKFVAEKCVKEMIKAGKVIRGAKVLILGLTFKENCPDLRNSKVVDVIKELKEYEVEILINDPVANSHEAEEEYGIKFTAIDVVKNIDAVIMAVKHDEFMTITKNDLKKLYAKSEEKPLIFDLKGIFNKKEMVEEFNYWRM
ncbi:nucleotide sugar dehydrogenase (plasmid) [Cetobacterium somerae]|uniref:nucleotide sugar dehydrogenase n=1 Tax=Cetobacterium somerae TaxID=188913 RepID=UPI001F0656C7|nr:nucleotide sugar dehydrogenase [Cetobacterium somerae]UPO98526.1 nucleotide sugar dehydrogenase [Cetobacterium somerae]